MTLVNNLLSGDCGYPASAQMRDGKMLTAYYSNGTSAHRRYHMGVVVWEPPAPGQDARPQPAAIAAGPARETFRERRRQAAHRRRRLIFSNDGDDPKSRPATAESLLNRHRLDAV